MGIGRTRSIGMIGTTGHVIDVEAHCGTGLPCFALVGLPDASLSESRDRVRAACSHSGYSIQQKHLTLSLSPASLPKHGSGFDLPVAVASLVASGVINSSAAENSIHLAELGLDGRLRPVHGVLPAVMNAVAQGFVDVVVSPQNAQEAALVPGARVKAYECLADLVTDLGGPAGVRPRQSRSQGQANQTPLVDEPTPPADLAEVQGQELGRWALEVAAAGGHHMVMMGPPGAGKTMLASRLPSIIPALTEQESIEVSTIQSICGSLDPARGLPTVAPFEAPHHSATLPALIGGGSKILRPGAISRAHRGVLFLDEAPEFSTRVLQALRQPLEQGTVQIVRAAGVATFPAAFQLVLAANPCPCGMAFGRGKDCTCTPAQRTNYLNKLSKPLLDRMDVRIVVEPVGKAGLSDAPGESSHVVAARVVAARAVQRQRWAQVGGCLNSQVPASHLRAEHRLSAKATRFLDLALERGTLTMRGYVRALRTSWTIADLRDHPSPTVDDVGQALEMRRW